jgi:hypothetical protein
VARQKEPPISGDEKEEVLLQTSSVSNVPINPERFQNYCNLRPLSDPSLSITTVTRKDFQLTRRYYSLDYDEIMANLIVEMR